MLALARGMLNCEDDDLVGGFVDRVVDEIRIFARHKFADPLGRLPPSNLGEQDEILQRVKDRGAYLLGGGRVMGAI